MLAFTGYKEKERKKKKQLTQSPMQQLFSVHHGVQALTKHVRLEAANIQLSHCCTFLRRTIMNPVRIVLREFSHVAPCVSASQVVQQLASAEASALEL